MFEFVGLWMDGDGDGDRDRDGDGDVKVRPIQIHLLTKKSKGR